jgi:hypothetical protein
VIQEVVLPSSVLSFDDLKNLMVYKNNALSLLKVEGYYLVRSVNNVIKETRK